MKTLIEVQQEFLTGAVHFILPEVALIGTACVLFLLGAFAAKRSTATVLGLFGVIGAMALSATVGLQETERFWHIVEGTTYSPYTLSPFDPTGLAPLVRWVALIATAAFLLLGWCETRGENAAEYAACILVLGAGASLVARANDLVSLFLALELVSIPTYVLLYLPIRTQKTQEAAAKYFLLSILSSGLFLFGLSYLYGLTGSTNLGVVLSGLIHAGSVGLMGLVAIILVIAGLGSRVTAFPFHFYAPDVYEGGPTGVVAQLAFIPKLIGFVALARLLGLLTAPDAPLPFDAVHTLIPLTLWVLAVVSMTFGNILALLQDNVKRMMAYSGVANAGYMLIGLVAALSRPDAAVNVVSSQNGLAALLFYLFAYGLMIVGFFAVLLHLSRVGREVESVDDLAGLGQSHPLSAGLLFTFLLSMIGIPLTAGFAGKLLLFISAFDAPDSPPMGGMYRTLAIIAAVNAAIAAVYYLRVIGVMFLRTALTPLAKVKPSPALLVAVLCALATVVLGCYPKLLADLTNAASILSR